MDNELSSMLSTLHSYRFEPCTYDMHDKFLELDNKGQVLKQSINKAKDIAQNSIKLSNNFSENINGILKNYHMFQKSLSIYLKEAVMHH